MASRGKKGTCERKKRTPVAAAVTTARISAAELLTVLRAEAARDAPQPQGGEDRIRGLGEQIVQMQSQLRASQTQIDTLQRLLLKTCDIIVADKNASCSSAEGKRLHEEAAPADAPPAKISREAPPNAIIIPDEEDGRMKGSSSSSSNSSGTDATVVHPTEPDVCAICSLKMVEGPEEIQNNSLILPGTCGHKYHAACILEWLRKKQPGTCPLCRRDWEFARNHRLNESAPIEMLMHHIDTECGVTDLIAKFSSPSDHDGMNTTLRVPNGRIFTIRHPLIIPNMAHGAVLADALARIVLGTPDVMLYNLRDGTYFAMPADASKALYPFGLDEAAEHCFGIAAFRAYDMGGALLFVKTLTGKPITVRLNLATSPALYLMYLIHMSEGIPINQQRIIFAGRQLERLELLSKYHIQAECTVHLVLHLRGGKPVINFYWPEAGSTGRKHSDLTVDLSLKLPADYSPASIYPTTPYTYSHLANKHVIAWHGIDVLPCSNPAESSLLHVRDTVSDHYPYLFWEFVSGASQQPWAEQFPINIVAPGAKVADALGRELDRIGLTPRERTDMVTYWIATLAEYEHVAIRFLPSDYVNKMFPITIQTVNAAVLADIYRVYIAFGAADGSEVSEPAAWHLPARNPDHLTIVEWGGIHLLPIK